MPQIVNYGRIDLDDRAAATAFTTHPSVRRRAFLKVAQPAPDR
jgi:hypothetical protein